MTVGSLFMGKLDEAQDILRQFGLPQAQQNEMAALTLLALAGLGQRDPWRRATRRSMRITKDIMAFMAKQYRRRYAPNTRETVRRQVLHQFCQARLAEYNPDNPNLPTNSPGAHYALTEAALNAIRLFGTLAWDDALSGFRREHGSLIEVYQHPRMSQTVPVRLSDGRVVKLSPGKHNQLQAAVVEKFAPRFTPGAKLMYLGDTAKKAFIFEVEQLQSFGLWTSDHDKLPDVILYDQGRQCLVLIEVVTSHGPVSPKRYVELETLLKDSPVKRMYVTAFQDFRGFKQKLREIAWDTEVWIAEVPDHLIHFNGDRFLSSG